MLERRAYRALSGGVLLLPNYEDLAACGGQGARQPALLGGERTRRTLSGGDLVEAFRG